MAHKLLRLMVPEPETPFGGLQQVFYAYMVQRYSTYDYEQNRFEQTGRIFHYQEWIWIQVNLVQIVCLQRLVYSLSAIFCLIKSVSTL